MSELSSYLADKVYPNLDAAEAGFFDSLNPKAKTGSNGKYYELDCPACEVKSRAFYYPGSALMRCNRRSECGKVTSVWDILQNAGRSNGDILRMLCEAANVPLPNDNRSPELKRAVSLTNVFYEIIRNALTTSEYALGYLRAPYPEGRGMSDAEISDARIGYYPSVDYVRDRLRAAGADLGQAAAWGLIGRTPREDLYLKKFEKRIVGYWEQPDGSVRLWGRGFGDSLKPYIGVNGETVEPKKYEFAAGMVKTVPYRFRQASRRSVLVAVEGPLDVERLCINGIPAVGIGGDCVIEAQARYMVSQGVQAIIHLTDGDRAGYLGGIKSVRFCEPVGITTYIASIPPEMDDPDTAIRNEGTEPLLELLTGAMNGGAYLARDMLEAKERYGLDVVRATQERLRLRDALTPASRVEFDLHLRAQGVALPEPKALALRLASDLIGSGVDEQTAFRLVRERYNLNIAVAREGVNHGG